VPIEHQKHEAFEKQSEKNRGRWATLHQAPDCSTAQEVRLAVSMIRLQHLQSIIDGNEVSVEFTGAAAAAAAKQSPLPAFIAQNCCIGRTREHVTLSL
jgi:hypothetical protein